MAERPSKKRGRDSGFWGALVPWLKAPAARRRRLFVRNIAVSSEVLAYVRGAGCTAADRAAFAELLFRLDANPLKSEALLAPRPGSPYPRGLRWAGFGGHKVVFQFDPGHDRIRLLVCEGPGGR